MKNKVVAFTIADRNNLGHYEKLKNSLKKFHPDLELILVDEAQVKATKDPNFYYRATPIVADNLLKNYDTVIKLDADQIITGDISHVWKGKFDVAVVNNSNPREMKIQQVNVWNIHPLSYVNCGFVVMKSKRFVKHWKNLCLSPHFNFYQYREQDLLNIMIYYGDWQTKFLDAGKKWHGLISKGYWPSCILKDDKLILPKNNEWGSEDKEIVCIHFAGGNVNKGNYKLLFKPEVVKWLDKKVK